MSGFADERRAASFAIEIRQAERAGAAAETEDPAGRLSRHYRGSRACDRMHKRRRETAGGGENQRIFWLFVNVYIDRITRD